MTISLQYFWSEEDADSETFLGSVKGVCRKFSSIKQEFIEKGDAKFDECHIDRIPTTIIKCSVPGISSEERITGCDAAGILTRLEEVTKKEGDLDARIAELLKSNSLMLFIKGTPDAPKCGFTRQLFALFNEHGIKNYAYFDILSDEAIRQRTFHLFMFCV